MKTTIYCIFCKKEFLDYLSNKKKFCSKRCAANGTWSNAEYRKKMSDVHKGKQQTLESRVKRSIQMTGEKHPQWQRGKTKEDKRLRGTMFYKEWRNAVFCRDNYQCQICGIRSGKKQYVYLNADHIKPFAYFPELRFEISNGRTLCLSCHKKTDTYMGRAVKNYKLKK